MQPLNAALLVNLLGFSVGIALYALLGLMVVRHRPKERGFDQLLLTTAALGVVWNTGELYSFAQRDFSSIGISPWLTAMAFSSLGFLPSVVVHSAQADEEGPHWLTYAAYALSFFAAVVHFTAAYVGSEVPSDIALTSQAFGSLALLSGLLIFNLKQTLEKKALWASALLVFAVSTLHLTGEREGSAWYIELLAHQSSLPLALVILYQNFRFAFADLFLKRAISLLFLAALALGLYAFIAVPLLRYHESHDRDDVQAAALIVGLWIATALSYPLIHKFAVWLVDRVILHRADYERLQREISREVEAATSVDVVLDTVRSRLSSALTARSSACAETSLDQPRLASLVIFSSDRATVNIETAEKPAFELTFTDLVGGRRLLSDEIALLESVALITARRIDVLRVSNERYDRELREQEFAKLAAQAQVAALRSQINPHFLFNALTTLGYLIKTSPEKAYDTLLTLTQLLRRVLKSTGEFSTIGDEVKLVETYLDIERARFEEKLTVRISVPDEMKPLRVPALVLQPLVENAIKHGISENRNGGEIRITGALERNNGNQRLKLSVWDSGSGKTVKGSDETGGHGLMNVRERLRSYYGPNGVLELKTDAENGTLAEISVSINDPNE